MRQKVFVWSFGFVLSLEVWIILPLLWKMEVIQYGPRVNFIFKVTPLLASRGTILDPETKILLLLKTVEYSS